MASETQNLYFNLSDRSFNEFLLKNQSAFDIHSIRVYKFLHGILRETFTVTKQKKAKPKGCIFLPERKS